MLEWTVGRVQYYSEPWLRLSKKRKRLRQWRVLSQSVRQLTAGKRRHHIGMASGSVCAVLAVLRELWESGYDPIRGELEMNAKECQKWTLGPGKSRKAGKGAV